MKRSDTACLLLAAWASACNTLTTASSAGAPTSSDSDGRWNGTVARDAGEAVTTFAPGQPSVPPEQARPSSSTLVSTRHESDPTLLDAAVGQGPTSVAPVTEELETSFVGIGDGGRYTGSLQLPPPHPCSNQFSVDGCVVGDATSACGGKCANDYGPTSKNACENGKEGVPVQFACARHMLFSSEMEDAAAEDGYGGFFHYAIVGHDPDLSGLDAGLPNSCCQCYQLVFAEPTYLADSVLPAPPPLVVQSANTQASGAAGFDIFMGAGGFGVFNACDGNIPLGTNAGHSQYFSYPAAGQAFNGGVKPGPDSLACDEDGKLSAELIAAPACQEKVLASCNELSAVSEYLQETSRRSCIWSNQAQHYYHENWNVYARRVQCPQALTDVTGCKPQPDPLLPTPDPKVRTATDALAAGFASTANGQRLHTTTMQDCCMPTCAWRNNVRIPTIDHYASFYSCSVDGTPITENVHDTANATELSTNQATK